MANEQALKKIALLAATDLSSYQYCAVYVSAANTVSLCNSLGLAGVGILQDEPAAASRACTVAVAGVTKWKAHTTISAGAEVTTSATGRAITATTGNYVYGIALEAATTAGDLISVLLKDSGAYQTYDTTLVAADAYTAKQYYTFVVDTNGKAALPTVQGQVFDGVVQTATGAGSTATVRTGGRSYGVAGAAITKGDKLMVDTSGRFITATAGNYGGAVSLSTASTAGDSIEVLLLPGIRVKGKYIPFGPFYLAGGSITAANAFELPVAMTLKSGFASCTTAPGSGKTYTVTITDGSTAKTVVISGTATDGEDKTFNTAYAAGANMVVSGADTGSATVGVSVMFWFQEVEA